LVNIILELQKMDEEVRAQCARIVDKLGAARVADRSLSVFGADAHKYEIGPTVSGERIRAFETDHGIKLPEHYAAFLNLVGNGSPRAEDKPAAGPFYGIYPLGFGINDFVYGGCGHLKELPFVKPDMTRPEWDEATKPLTGEEISDDKYGNELRRIFGGLLPIGHQGCQSYHALILQGQNAGKVVNIDTELFLPVFCYENNFLDWYERWLDEIISGALLKDGPTWFGYTMGGDDKHLLKIYHQSEDKSKKLATLDGFGKLISICADSALEISKIAQSDNQELRRRATLILAEFDYTNARSPLEDLLKGPSEDQLTACKAIHWHAKKYAGEWVDVVGPITAKTSDIELFRFSSYVLESSGMDCTRYLLPAASHQDEDIRQQAVHMIGKSLNNPQAVEAILIALGDESPKVVHAALQAHEKPFDHRFLEAYASIATRFEVDEHYVLTNLNHRLRAIGYHNTAAFVSDFKAGRVRKRGFWTRIFR
jgi:hypothetical protein